jgi:hypothetical protein
MLTTTYEDGLSHHPGQRNRHDCWGDGHAQRQWMSTAPVRDEKTSAPKPFCAAPEGKKSHLTILTIFYFLLAAKIKILILKQ